MGYRKDESSRRYNRDGDSKSTGHSGPKNTEPGKDQVPTEKSEPVIPPEAPREEAVSKSVSETKIEPETKPDESRRNRESIRRSDP
jgi:hypothetical protein